MRPSPLSPMLLASAAAVAQCPPNWVQQFPTSSPGSRYGHSLWFDAPRGRTLLFGGVASGMAHSDTWAWSGTTWTQLHPAHQPGPRSYAATAYDPVRDRAMIFGGMLNTQGIGETWEFDGADWMLVAESGPSDRLGAGAAYHAGLQRIVLFGGRVSNSGTQYGDTWLWNGSSWVQLPIAGPSSRALHGMCPFGGNVLSVGVQLYSGAFANTWLFDGAAWTQVAPDPALIVPGQSISYDPGRGRALTAYFGYNQGDYRNSWEFDGTTWTQVANDGPPARSTGAMAYDSIRDRVVFYGTDSLSNPGQTWEWHGPPGPFAPRVTLQPVLVAVDPGQPAGFTAAASGPAPLNYRWRRDGVDLLDGPAVGGGVISGASTASLSITPAYPADGGHYDAVISNQCGQVATATARLICPAPACNCYANCDSSTIPPCLNVLDFSCFLGQFAAASTRANCDGSTTPPVLNVQDFSCFLNAFAAGCS